MGFTGFKTFDCNKVALYRRARVISLPVNAGVEDIKMAIKDL